VTRLDESLADPTTALGQLQRGRGAGWLAATGSSEGRELLAECLARDPRWDTQGESRASYYAELALELEVPAADVDPDAVVDEDTKRLRFGVLAAMAERKATDALEVILGQLRPGPLASDAAWRLSDMPGEPTSAQLALLIDARFEPADLEVLVAERRKSLPWDEWSASHDSIDRAVRRVDQRRTAHRGERPQPPSLDAPVDELVAWEWGPTLPKALLHRFAEQASPDEVEAIRVAAKEPGDSRRWFPLAVLGRRNDPAALPLAAQIFERNTMGGERASALRYISALDATLTLPLARSWMLVDDDRRGVAAHLMALHSEPSDLPAIRDAFADAFDEGSMYEVCDLIDALGRHPDLGPFPELRTAFVEIGYSYARRRAARAMATVDPDFTDTFALECLWDCESATRELGAINAPITPRALTRLSALASHDFEPPNVVAAARARFESATTP
jgi:hypothetical protein